MLIVAAAATPFALATFFLDPERRIGSAALAVVGLTAGTVLVKTVDHLIWVRRDVWLSWLDPALTEAALVYGLRPCTPDRLAVTWPRLRLVERPFIVNNSRVVTLGAFVGRDAHRAVVLLGRATAKGRPRRA